MAHLLPMDAAWRARSGERRVKLRRTRALATALLLSMLAIFAICWRLEAAIPWLAYMRAFAEAGTVGACADWFAVVALFRHPLGLPIPHTAILPRNKQRIGDTLGAFVARNFFSPSEIEPRLDKIDVAGLLSGWLRNADNVQLLVKWSRGLLPSALDFAGSSQLRNISGGLIKKGIDSIAAAPLAGRVLAVLVAQGQHDAAFNLGIEAAIDFLGSNRAAIRLKAAEKSSGWLPGWVDAKLADAFLDGMRETLVAARAADHPWRDEFHAFTGGLIARLADDPEFYDRGEQIKASVLDAKLVDDYLAWLTAETETTLKAELDNEVVAEVLGRVLAAIADWIDNSDGASEAINRSARQLVTNTVVPHRDDIAAYVSDIVARWDNETLVERLELQVGGDLQFIRINGTLVGGAVGLAIYTLTRLLG